LLKSGQQGLFKHDDYMVNPSMFDLVIQEAQEFFVMLREKNLYGNYLEQISAKLRKKSAAPKLYIGNAANKIKESFNFLI